MPKPTHHPRATRRPRKQHTGLLLRVTAGLLVTASLLVGNSKGHAQTIPTDADPTCVVSGTDFEKWFVKGSVSLDGVVKPADSVNFPDVVNCDFYKWSAQMFLWLTSPDGGGRIVDSSEFYDVSLPGANHKRTFLPHDPRVPIRTFNLRSAQAGPHGLQVLFDKAGKMFEIAPSRKAPSGKPLVLNKLGKLVEVASARMKDGKPVLLDKAGHPIASPKPIPEVLAALPARLLERGKTISMAYEFMIGKTPIFLDANGEVINAAVGQAGGNGVLMAQTKSLIYYVTMVNDVFAYFLTGAETGGIQPKPKQFPTTPDELKKVENFASLHGKTFKNPQALVIEVKSSWVEVDKLRAAGFDPKTYITMAATIPTYSNYPNHETWNGKDYTYLWWPEAQFSSRPVQLAMVGMHVVGSVKGNPEMLWATFEHFGNTPNAAYDYVAVDGHGNKTKKTVEQNTTGRWLFSASGATDPFNVPQMTAKGPKGLNIESHSPMMIGSNTLRTKPWGGAANQAPNDVCKGKANAKDEDCSTAASNSEIIAINNSVLGKLFANDVRKYYFMMGNTWTKKGKAPTGSYTGKGPELPGEEVGTSQLANSTMETYHQGTRLVKGGTNCFSCHTASDDDHLIPVSHIYEDMEPLPPR